MNQNKGKLVEAVPGVVIDEKTGKPVGYTQPLSEEMLSLKEAVAYINAKYSGDEQFVTKDAFYLRVRRGGIPCKKVGKFYYFLREDLDKIRFRSKVSPSELNAVHVKTDEDMRHLVDEYGPLVDMNGLLEAIDRKIGRQYSRGAVKQRLLRGTIYYVGYIGSEKRKIHLFPLKQLEDMYFQADSPYRRKALTFKNKS